NPGMVLPASNSVSAAGSRPMAAALMGAGNGSAGLINADFHITDPGDPAFGWTVRGSGSVLSGQAVLNEDDRVFTGFSQTFVVPQGATTLRFTVSAVHFGANGPLNPPDAFEAALLDAATMASLVG